MEVKVGDNECWVCGESGNKSNIITIHHTLPQHLKPKNNVLIPVCKNCHENKINSNDISGLHSFAFKLEKEFERQMSMWSNFRKTLGEFIEMEAKLFEAFKKKEDNNGKTISK